MLLVLVPWRPRVTRPVALCGIAPSMPACYWAGRHIAHISCPSSLRSCVFECLIWQTQWIPASYTQLEVVSPRVPRSSSCESPVAADGEFPRWLGIPVSLIFLAYIK
ncbi:hypothetical protein F5883DRAFT_579427 [Diaporthe sp. PMI_573]|nr:hypothetical protein F5883DRAFT_579427 [Diaporthaceae sp. PMI_573]